MCACASILILSMISVLDCSNTLTDTLVDYMKFLKVEAKIVEFQERVNKDFLEFIKEHLQQKRSSTRSQALGASEGPRTISL